ncbi:bifunctional phosphopantothenoylcysteine decarboxylase/phosphopantothenate--cysteine ligase CoaBC [Zooshikella harenae]|uniref:Coenzyme A biosynthesis bifunctional protein CoaBC n=1 Tax=Zooshikella harenae TaxID=2827238 RepID=A0ABS5ZFK8_9GAMM|nr:bifunctional phosphopantothenoylcysteine decarboxylase/phosphopantothenate--cysteine ligase CoaBC [Zooshikella harenae]MBU2712799.1 bifunctional phosphopantothenoylcysteine decarboxylase/phosphopantothenate--cysteine ligase CoaBC [Zooshikella harenae]
MHQLQSKKIVLGITGGIAAYKSAELVRRLRDAGAEVRVVMSKGAQAFITPLTFQALSSHPVHTELLTPEAEAGMNHIELARWADLVIIAPATANCLSSLAQGRADDLLSTLCLATQAPLCIAPAMNQQMWQHAATQHNLQCLIDRGVRCFGPAQGFQACGEVGPGRMLEAAEIAQLCAEQFSIKTLTGRHVVITAGPTQEAIDPVRYISNHSSGKMGFALAQAAVDAGADVTLISGPVQLTTPAGVKRIDVDSANAMHQAVQEHIVNTAIFIGCAAVADYRPKQIASQKLKKDPTNVEQTMTLTLVRNPDIITNVANMQPKPFVVGFAAETEALEQHAKDKLARKKLDMIIANDVSQSNIGFNSDQNAVTVFTSTERISLEQNTKFALAKQLISLIHKQLSS